MKHTKKHALTLTRETVRHLTDPALARVAGAITTTPPPSMQAGHGCTSLTNCECPAVVTADCNTN